MRGAPSSPTGPHPSFLAAPSGKPWPALSREDSGSPSAGTAARSPCSVSLAPAECRRSARRLRPRWPVSPQPGPQRECRRHTGGSTGPGSTRRHSQRVRGDAGQTHPCTAVLLDEPFSPFLTLCRRRGDPLQFQVRFTAGSLRSELGEPCRGLLPTAAPSLSQRPTSPAALRPPVLPLVLLPRPPRTVFHRRGLRGV